MKRHLLIIPVLLLTISTIAQEALCPVPERAAIAEAQVWCSELEDNQLCYGNSGIQADLLSDVPFNALGDTVSLNQVTRINSSVGDNQYGVALVDTISYAPDNWLAQPVTLAVLGDVTIANTGNEGINIETVSAPIISEAGANIRSGPTTEYRLLTSLFEGDLVKLTGRFRDDSAYRVQLPSGETGWLIANAVDADVSGLPIVDLESPSPDVLYAPFTSFSLQTGINDAGCAEAWQSGVLLQTPVDSLSRIVVNENTLAVSGTVFLQADAERTLVHVIEGQVTYQDETVDEGYTIAIFADSSQIAAYNIDDFAPLPTEILPRYTYIGVDVTTLITPAPDVDRSPIADVLVDDPCVITTGQTGANLRAGPSSDFPIRAVLAFRETVNPISRINGSDGLIWYEIAQNLWVSGQVVVTGGDCLSVPQAQRIPVLLPTATPES